MVAMTKLQKCSRFDRTGVLENDVRQQTVSILNQFRVTVLKAGAGRSEWSTGDNSRANRETGAEGSMFRRRKPWNMGWNLLTSC